VLACICKSRSVNFTGCCICTLMLLTQCVCLTVRALAVVYDTLILLSLFVCVPDSADIQLAVCRYVTDVVTRLTADTLWQFDGIIILFFCDELSGTLKVFSRPFCQIGDKVVL
jgi:hypothetical protein